MASLRRGEKHSAVAGVGLLVASLVVLHLAVPDGWIGEASYLGVILGAGLCALFAALRRSHENRAAWCWVAGGVFLSSLGDLSWSIYVHVQGVEPDISVADVPWLASYVALSIGLLMLLRAARQDDRSDVDGMIDMAVVGVVSLLVVWQIAVQSTLTNASVEPGVRAIWASYPILDAVLLALVIRVRLGADPGRSAPGRGRRELVVLGLLLHAVSIVDGMVGMARRGMDDWFGAHRGRGVESRFHP